MNVTVLLGIGSVKRGGPTLGPTVSGLAKPPKGTATFINTGDR